MATKKKAPTVKMKCEDCIHLDCVKAVSKKKVCSQLGVKGYSLACELFNADVKKVARNSVKQMKALQYLTNNMDSSSQRLLAMALLRTSSIRERGFKLGEKVYYDWYNSDTLDSYITGYITGVSGEYSEFVILAGDLGDENTASITVEWSSIIKKEDFETIKNDLVAQDKLFAKRSERKATRAVILNKVRERGDLYVRTIDDLASHSDDTPKGRKVNKPKSDIPVINIKDMDVGEQTISF
jgi:hypothetical protein